MLNTGRDYYKARPSPYPPRQGSIWGSLGCLSLIFGIALLIALYVGATKTITVTVIEKKTTWTAVFYVLQDDSGETSTFANQTRVDLEIGKTYTIEANRFPLITSPYNFIRKVIKEDP